MSAAPQQQWPADSRESWELERLTPYAQNARMHTDDQIERIVNSMSEWGFTIPVLVDEAGTIIAGHGRVRAAKILVERGEEKFSRVPVMIARGWSEAQRRAYVIADNQLALASSWDMRLLALELEEVTQLGISVDLLGFSDADLASIEAVGVHLDDIDHWRGMPEFEQPHAAQFRDIIVHFKTQADVDAFAKLLDQNITDDTKYVWFPKEERVSMRDYRYESDEAGGENLLEESPAEESIKQRG